MSTLFSSTRNFTCSIVNLPLFRKKCARKYNIYMCIFNKVYRFYSELSLRNVPIDFHEKNNLNQIFLNKILYNDILNKIKRPVIDKNKTQPHPLNLQMSEPIFLKIQKNKTNIEEEVCEENNEDEKKVNFPYDIKQVFITKCNLNQGNLENFPDSFVNFTPSDYKKLKYLRWKKEKNINPKDIEDPRNWMPKENDNIVEENVECKLQFGTYDPNVPVSNIPCGGCGSFFHCTDPSIPGFLPKELFVGFKREELLSEICQRCFFLKEYDVALGVNVSPEEYPKILGQIKKKTALAILMVDLLDFPCGIWSGIMDIIGFSKPLVIVGNKVDLLINDCPSLIKNIRYSLKKSLESCGIPEKNILEIALISAKTGFGIEHLIDILHTNWSYKGDVYLIGSTNAGKSTLFNTLIQSDYCKAQAIDLLQRATVSSWPGTTLNLLKFPVMRPASWRLFVRQHRLKLEKKEKEAWKKLETMYLDPTEEQVPLRDYVGRSFQSDPDKKNTFQINIPSEKSNPKGFDPEDFDFRRSKWCYDTPGVVNRSQIINLLTTAEINMTIPKQMVLPRNFSLQPGTSLFLGGLARLDYLTGPHALWFTVYASRFIPVTVTKVEDADLIYEKLLGSNLFCVPSGEKERLLKWPKLSSEKIEIYGKVKDEASTDIVLSSAGWVTIVAPLAYRCKVEAWTPEGRGIYVREPIIKMGHKFRGSRIPNTPAFKTVVKEIESVSFWDNIDE